MRRTLFLISILSLCCLGIQAQTAFEEGNRQYADGNYSEAAAQYEQVIGDTLLNLSDVALSEVYYNLGNAYFRQGELARSILSYERALRLDSRNQAARHNLEFAEQKIVDNIPDKSNFFLRQWVRRLIDCLPLSVWMTLSISLFILSLAMLLVFLFFSTPLVRRIGFHTAWVALLLSACSLLFAANAHSRRTDTSLAIVTQGIVNVKSSPDRSGTDLFVIHEGTKVRITDHVGEWIEIHVGDNIGWIRADYAEVI